MKAVRHSEQGHNHAKTQRCCVGRFVPLTGDSSSSDGNVAVQQSRTHDCIREDVSEAKSNRADQLAHLLQQIARHHLASACTVAAYSTTNAATPEARGAV